MARTEMTTSRQLVLRQLLPEPGTIGPAPERYGLEISQTTGLAPGTVHPILDWLEHHLGWATSRRENEGEDQARAGRARRRYYRLTPDGVTAAYKALELARIPPADQEFQRRLCVALDLPEGETPQVILAQAEVAGNFYRIHHVTDRTAGPRCEQCEELCNEDDTCAGCKSLICVDCVDQHHCARQHAAT